MSAEKIGPQHRARKAVLYVRQSSAHQVQHNRESQALQYAMRDRLVGLGFAEVEIIDEDLVCNDNFDVLTYCLTQECSRAYRSLPHADAPGGLVVDAGALGGPSTKLVAISVRQSFRRRCTVRSRPSG
jgi:hypothetical protein